MGLDLKDLKDLEDYAERMTTDESDVLYQLARETNIKVLRPRMLCGKLQGKLLNIISHMIKPGRILELGTYTGYSAICLAQGLPANGLMHTIEKNPELEDIIIKYISKAGLKDKIKLHIGDALDIIPTLDEVFELVYIDADKENYPEYYKMAMGKLAKGGVIIADNVLWSGKVLKESEKDDKETRAIIKFNNIVAADRRTENLLLPFRDGLMIIRKK